MPPRYISPNPPFYEVYLLLTFVLKTTVSIWAHAANASTVCSPNSTLYAVCFLLTYTLKINMGASATAPNNPTVNLTNSPSTQSVLLNYALKTMSGGPNHVYVCFSNSSLYAVRFLLTSMLKSTIPTHNPFIVYSPKQPPLRSLSY
jgi:hypothetical protein